MIKPIQMTRLMCNYKDHQDENVSALCIRSQCKIKSACCPQCMVKFHSECLKNMFFNQVPELAGIIYNLETIYQGLVSKLDQILKQFKKTLDFVLKPIKDYQENPNMENLNGLGELLRDNPSDSITQFSNKLQKLIDDELTKVFNDFPSSIVKSIEPTQIQKQEAENLFEECERFLGTEDDLKQLSRFEKIIELVPNNELYLFQKGCCLQRLKRFNEAIESFNKSISIKPFLQVYLSLIRLLITQNRSDEAQVYCNEGLQIFTNNKLLLEQLDSAKGKQN